MSQGVAWIWLIVAGLLDVAWAISMKYAEGYTRPGWSVASLLLLGAFVYLLGRVLETLPWLDSCSRTLMLFGQQDF